MEILRTEKIRKVYGKDSIGIGLALAKAVVEMENGYISVISENGFTEFIIKHYTAQPNS